MNEHERRQRREAISRRVRRQAFAMTACMFLMVACVAAGSVMGTLLFGVGMIACVARG